MNYIKLYYDLAGAFVSSDNDIIVGRSHLSNKIQLYTDVALASGSEEAIQVYFVLANGQVTPKRTIAYSGTEEVDGHEYYKYEYSIPSSVLSKVTSSNSETLLVQFRKVGIEYDEQTESSYYTHILAFEQHTLTINASIIPNEEDDVIYVDEYTDLDARIEAKQSADWTTYPTVTEYNDTDYLTLANGTTVSNKIEIGDVIAQAQGNLTNIQTDLNKVLDQFDQTILDSDLEPQDQKLSTSSSPTFAGLTSTNGLVIDTKAIDWNEDEGTFDIVLNGATLQVGQETHFYGKAIGDIENGDVVFFDSPQGNHSTFHKATSADLAFPQGLMGIATEDITNNNYGHVTWFGKVRDVTNTTSETWAVGDILYVSNTTGQLTNVEPSLTEETIQVAAVIAIGNLPQQSNIVLLVRPYFIEENLLDETGVVDETYLPNTLVDGASFAGTTLTLTRANDGTSINVDLSSLSEDAEIISSGELVEEAPNWYIRFTRTDLTTFDVDVTSLIDDTNLITSVAGRTGDITLTEADITDFGTYLTEVTEEDVTQHEAALSITESQITDLDKYTQAEVDALIAQGSTTIKEQRFIITNNDNGDGTFSYTWLGNARTGDLTAGVYTFTLEESVEYIIGQGRIQAFVNNDVRYASNDPEFTEATTTTFSLEYALQNGDDVNAVIYQGLDTVSIEVGADTITRTELAQAVEDDIDAGKNHSQIVTGNPHSVTYTDVGAEPANANIQTHIGTTSGNPHSVTKDEVGLGNVTNDAQVKKRTSSTDGRVPTWNGTTGDALNDGYGVETSTLLGGTNELVRADVIKTYADTKATVSNYTTTIATTDTWTDQTGYFTLAKTVSGILDEDIHIALDLTSVTDRTIKKTMQEEFAQITDIYTSTDTITFETIDSPTFTYDMPFKIEVIR